ncbi:hypothetical protein KGA66_04980 [Actinocrinis puniceicyclus]|uniref:Uncharacterized protein n=1 Tax=Actinocrinis puniceicyclus TaxID=977794 RepID=A0A8J7WJD0_9ACTN|nr:hypothetical protein [Actinocrinis puniceicyclus]MBS2962388.1 hypothetical protein [Actinocrinis puniceicyclus]
MQAPPNAQFEQVGTDRTGRSLVISTEYTTDVPDEPTGIPLVLPADPARWVADLCATVPRALRAGSVF